MAEIAAGEHGRYRGAPDSVEVAERLRVTRTTVYAWLKSGRLRGLRAGKAWRIRTKDLESFMRGARTEPGGPVPGLPDLPSYREALLAVLRAGDSDSEARERLFALPGGEDALTRVMDLKAARRRFEGLGISSDGRHAPEATGG